MTWTVLKLIEWTDEYLKKQGILKSRLESEMLLAQVLNKKRIELYVAFDRIVTEQELSLFKSLIQRRTQHEPIQYILGRQEFWSLDFKVGPGVLIPRPETECLIEQALKVLRHPEVQSTEGSLQILDLCTGSGAIAVALAKELPKAKIWAVDISDKALEYAHQNAKVHQVADRIEFIQSNLFENLTAGQKFDLIVSNPPYISNEEWNTLDSQIKDYEPKEALLGGEEGIDFHLRILKEAPKVLKQDGSIILEIAPHQALLLKNFLIQEKKLSKFEIVKDYEQRERILSIQHG